MKRFALIVALTALGIVASFADAFYGLLLYAWYAFASPLELSYGMLAGSKLSFLVAMVVILTTFVQKGKLFFLHSITVFSFLFVIICALSLAVQGIYGLSYISDSVELLAKIVFMAVLAPVLLESVRKAGVFVFVIAVSGGLLGAYYGLFGLFAGSFGISGPGRIGDNNLYALFLVALLPFVYYASVQFRSSLASWGAVFLLLLNALACVLTFSRGGFLAMCIVLLLLICQIRKKVLLTVMILMVLPVIFFAVSNVGLLGEHQFVYNETGSGESLALNTLRGYLYRVRSIFSGGEETSSGISRMHFWNVALKMAADNPVLGVGFNNYRNNYDRYDDSRGRYGRVRSVHNLFLLILAETGIAGALSFVIVILLCLAAQSRAKSRLVLLSSEAEAGEILSYITMLRISMMGFFIGSMFVSSIFQEILWVYITLSIAVDRLSKEVEARAGRSNIIPDQANSAKQIL